MAPYSGSNLLAPLSNELAVPIDQINFIFCELLALVLAAAFRLYLHPRLVSPTVRHAVAGTVGLILGFFCFGRQMLHMIAQAAICYAIMRFWPRKNQHIAAFVFAMVYLSIMHIYRMYQDYGGYSLDITGPLMISTQKVTSLAFSVHDGLYKEKKDLNPDQNRQAVSDYIDFIEGSNFQVKQVGPTVVEANGEMEIDKTEENKAGEEMEDSEPSPLGEVAKKMGCTLACAGVAILIAPTYSIEMSTELPFIQNHTFIYRVLFLMVACMLARAKYYFAWKFGEAVSNASGLGFNGYTPDGKPIWDLVTNVNIRKLETATSLKVLVDSWNVQTTIWLRRICYDRLKYQKTVWTFVLSALWHGFYPGYYFTFLGGTFFIEAARKVRRRVRPCFLTAWWKKMIYDITTWFFAQLSLAYLILPFACLEFWPVFHFYHKSMHWFLHLGVVVILLVLPSKMREITPQ